jgi:hypothetical protein
MPDIRTGFVTALYLFDVAQAIDVVALKARLGVEADVARLNDKAAGPARLAYVQPPVIADGRAFGVAEIDGFRVRLKFFDYGVVSLMLTRPFSGSWTDLVAAAQALIESEPLEQHATDACTRVAEAVGPELKSRHPTFLSEDYLIFAVTSLEPAESADALVAAHGDEIAQMLRGERQTLSRQECDQVLRSRLSYLTDDLVVPAWNAAFIYDTESAARAAIEIIEYANSQLLEFRYHDDLLDAELTRAYGRLEQPRWLDRFAGRRHTLAARHLQSIFIDVNELTDRIENAVKFVGDVYSARLFVAVAGRLGLERWKKNVDDKLETLDDIYRFAVERASTSQANLLELVIVLILVIELGLFFAGIMK